MTTDASTQTSSGPWGENARFNAAALMCTLIISTLCWLIIGSIAYSDWINHGYQDLTACISVFLTMGAVGFLFMSCLESELAWPDPAKSKFISSLTGFGISIMYCILATGWENRFQRVFWALGGLYLGGVIELVTCVSCRCVIAVAHSARSAKLRREQIEAEKRKS